MTNPKVGNDPAGLEKLYGPWMLPTDNRKKFHNRNHTRLSKSPTCINVAAEELNNSNLEVGDDGVPWEVVGHSRGHKQPNKNGEAKGMDKKNEQGIAVG